MNISKFVLLGVSVTSMYASTIMLTPEQSISETMIKVRSGDTLSLASGEFKESIIVKDNVVLLGSGVGKTIIRGNGRGSVVTMNGSSVLQNCTVSGGQNGIQTQSERASIRNVEITENRGSGVLSLKAFPEISNCIISYNGGNGIQAATIGGGSLILDSLTIVENGGFGIEWDGSVPVSVMHSLFYKNGLKAFKSKDNQIVASDNVIFPEQKEYVAKNRTMKPEFKNDRDIKSLYIQTESSPGKGCGAVIK